MDEGGGSIACGTTKSTATTDAFFLRLQELFWSSP
jgi:hypothetical protein